MVTVCNYSCFIQIGFTTWLVSHGFRMTGLPLPTHTVCFKMHQTRVFGTTRKRSDFARLAFQRTILWSPLSIIIPCLCRAFSSDGSGQWPTTEDIIPVNVRRPVCWALNSAVGGPFLACQCSHIWLNFFCIFRHLVKHTIVPLIDWF